MVSIQEAQASVTQARAQISEAQQTLTKQEQQVEAVKFPSRSLKFQQEVIRTQPKRFAGRIKAERGKLSKQKREAKGEIGLERSRLRQIEKEKIEPVEASIAEYKARQASIDEAQRAFDRGLSIESDFRNPYTKSYLKQMKKEADIYGQIQSELIANPELLSSKIEAFTSKGISEDVALRKLGLRVDTKDKISDINVEVTSKEIEKINLEGAQIKKPSFFSKVKNVFGKAENITREKITEPYIFEPLQKIGITKEKLSEVARAETNIALTPTPLLLSKKTKEQWQGIIKPISDIQASITKGGFSQAREKPLETTSLFVGGSIVGSGVKGLSIAAKSSKIAGAGLKVSKVAGLGLGATYAGATGYQVYKAPTIEEKGEFIGRELVKFGALGAGSIMGARATGFSFEPITVKTPTRAIRTPEVREVQFPVVVGGKQTRVGSFRITGEKTPPMLEYQTTRLKSLIGIKPKTATIVPPRTFTIKTLEPVIQDKSFYVGEFVQGRKGVKIKGISGKSKLFKPKLELNDLSRTEQFALQRQLSSKIGREIPLEDVAKFYTRNQQLTRSSIGTTEFGKLTGTKRIVKWDLPKAGKVRSSSQAISESNNIIKTEEYDVDAFITTFKDVSNPFARASGKTPSLKGFVKYYKKPIVLDSPKTKGFKISGGKKTPFSKTFGLQEQTFEPLPKPVIKTPKTPKTTITKQITPTSKLLPIIPQIKTPTIKQKISQRTETKVISQVKTTPIQKQLIKQELRPIQKIAQRPVIKFATNLSPKLQFKQLQKPATKLLQKPALKVKTTKTPGFGITSTPTPIRTLYPVSINLKRRPTPVKKKKSILKASQRTRYTPSITATTFGYFSKNKQKKILGGYFPGIRPVIR